MCCVKVSVWFLLLFGRDTNHSTSEGCHSYSVSIRPVSGLVLDLDLQLDHDKVEGIKPFCRRCVQDVKTLAHLAERSIFGANQTRTLKVDRKYI